MSRIMKRFLSSMSVSACVDRHYRHHRQNEKEKWERSIDRWIRESEEGEVPTGSDINAIMVMSAHD